MVGPSRTPSGTRRLEDVRKSLLFIAGRWEAAARRGRDPARPAPYGEPTAAEVRRMRRFLRRGTTQYLADTLPPSFVDRFERATAATPHAWGAERAWRCLVRMALEVRERDVA
jgi:hypothetical protein